MSDLNYQLLYHETLKVLAEAAADTERRAALEVALSELTDLMQGVIDGDYKPDSFTLQPARAALSGQVQAKLDRFVAYDAALERAAQVAIRYGASALVADEIRKLKATAGQMQARAQSIHKTCGEG